MLMGTIRHVPLGLPSIERPRSGDRTLGPTLGMTLPGTSYGAPTGRAHHTKILPSTFSGFLVNFQGPYQYLILPLCTWPPDASVPHHRNLLPLSSSLIQCARQSSSKFLDWSWTKCAFLPGLYILLPQYADNLLPRTRWAAGCVVTWGR